MRRSFLTSSRGIMRSRDLEGVEDALHDRVGRELLGFGLVRPEDAVTEAVGADGLDVLGGDVAAVAEEGVGSRGDVAGVGGARRGLGVYPDDTDGTVRDRG